MKFRVKKERKFLSGKVWVSILIIAIMVLSTAGFLIGGRGQSGSLSYNKHTFTKEPNGYYTNLNGKNVRFDFFPAEINETFADKGAIDRIKNTKMIYMTSNFSGKYAQTTEEIKYELSMRLAREFGIYAASGFTTNTSYKTMTVSCSNATQFAPVVDFKEGNNTGIRLEGNCVVVEGNSNSGFIALKDRLLYGMHGIME